MNPIPTLSTSGWIKDLDEGGSRLLSYFMTSDGYQSNEYKGHVQSLPYLIMKHSEYPIEMETAIKNALTTLYTEHYDNAEVEVSIENENDTGSFNIIVKLTFTVNNEYKDLNRVLRVTDKNVITILGGDGE